MLGAYRALGYGSSLSEDKTKSKETDRVSFYLTRPTKAQPEFQRRLLKRSKFYRLGVPAVNNNVVDSTGSKEEPTMKAFRNPSTDRNGSQFSEATKTAVWNKAAVIPGVDPRLRRKDVCGAWIDWLRYGETDRNGTGWEIDHIRPVARNGTDDLSNLQPLQWENNRSKGDDYPASGFCAVAGK
jgi:HNH endonuclease